jgi:hypothetical protein
MAALTLNRSLRFLQALAPQFGGEFDQDRVLVRRTSDAVLNLKKVGWSRVRHLGHATVISRRDGSWPVAIQRTDDGKVAVSLPIVDSEQDLAFIEESMRPSAKLRTLINEWKHAQINRGVAFEAEWTTPAAPHFNHPEFVKGPGLTVTTWGDGARVTRQHIRSLRDMAELLGYTPVGYEERDGAYTYFDIFFIPDQK